MSIYEKTNVARALLYWAKNNNGNEAYYLEDRMYAVADGDMVIILTADSYDEAIRKAKARHTQGDLADEVWKLYKKHQSHLATYVLEFGEELADLLSKYNEGGAV